MDGQRRPFNKKIALSHCAKRLIYINRNNNFAEWSQTRKTFSSFRSFLVYLIKSPMRFSFFAIIIISFPHTHTGFCLLKY